MSAPVNRLKKDEIIWLGSHKCEKHGHNYLEHYNCYLTENPNMKRVGFLDIETSDLKANFGIILCYCIKEAGVDTILHRMVTKKEVYLPDTPDKAVVESCIKDMQKFDLLYTYYGTGFDLPFIRTRAKILNLDFPTFGTIKHKDVYYIIRNKFKLNRNGLETACRELLGSTAKTHFGGDMWRQAVQGESTALAYVLEHCKADVIDLEKLTNVVLDYVGPNTNSI
jgi:uncharacterized protein YprB with RNaseH-like and TPR domain